MSNVQFLSVPGRLRAYERLTADIREILERRFKGHLKLIEEGDHWWRTHLDIEQYDEWPYGGWEGYWIGIASRRKLSIKHTPCEFLAWTQEVVLNELGSLYKGRMSDEGVNENWEPDVTKFPTFESYTKRYDDDDDPFGSLRPRRLLDKLDPKLRSL